MWNVKCQLPQNFSERANSIFAHLDDYALTERTADRRLSLGKAALESCRLLKDLNLEVFAEDVVQILKEGRFPKPWQAPPEEFYRFLEAESRLLRESGFSELANTRVQQLIVEARRLQGGSLRPSQDIVSGLRELQEVICAASDDRVRQTDNRRTAKRVGWGIGGVSLAGVNMLCGIPVLFEASVGAGVDMIWNAIH